MDITRRSDIERLVNCFYTKAKVDDVIGIFFTQWPMDWERHLPLMYSFWENALFFSGGYAGNMMEVHRKVHEKMAMKPEHFERWTHLFCQTVDENFEGETAERAKQRALGMATMLQIKIPVV